MDASAAQARLFARLLHNELVQLTAALAEHARLLASPLARSNPRLAATHLTMQQQARRQAHQAHQALARIRRRYPHFVTAQSVAP
jgi:hypothetical protein